MMRRFARSAWWRDALCAATGSVVACSLAGCVAETGSARFPVLVDATERSGLSFIHDCGDERTYFMPELMGPGAAWIDYDVDGDFDLYFVSAGPPVGIDWSGALPTNRLFSRGPDGRFADVTAGSGLDDDYYGMGVAVGDVDNDGRPDVYVTNYGPNRLYRNRGDGTFEEITGEASVGDPAWSTSANFVDYDGDGWLDLYVANYLDYDPGMDCPAPTGKPEFCAPGMFEGVPDRLYRNNGDGTFTDVSESSGIASFPGKGLGVIAADFTDDGRPDFYVANDQQANNLWVANGDGTFRDDGVVTGLAFNDAGASEASMGLAAVDLDGDLRLDLYVTHLRGESNTAYLRDAGVFRDGTAGLGLHGTTLRYTGFGVAGVDLELDGDVDLLVVNGHVFRAEPEPGADLGTFWNDYGQPGLVLLNEGDRFTNVSAETGSFGRVPQVGRSIVPADVDDDGDVDFAVGNCNGPGQLFMNETPRAGRWLTVRPWLETQRRDAYGARVYVEAGGRTFVRLAQPGTGYLSSGDPRAHFGLGNATRYDAIEIVWPDGMRERFAGGEAERHIKIVRGTGEIVDR